MSDAAGTVKPGSWLKRLDSFCKSVIGRESWPITFLLGAGASRSSGGPMTDEVVAAVRRAYPDIFPTDDSVYQELDQLPEIDRRNTIMPLFKHRSPYVGYLMIAAIARRRAVTIVNLNWDHYVTQACDMLGVQCVDCDLADDPASIRKARECAEADGCGVVNIHVHGMFGVGAEPPTYPLRIGRLETVSLQFEQLVLLQECFDEATIVAGASLCAGRERDTIHLIQALNGSSREHEDVEIKPLWLLARESPGAEPDNTIYAALEHRRASKYDLHGPDVDFDRAMWALRAADAGSSWEALRKNHEELSLIPEREMMMPSPRLLRKYLAPEAPLVVLPGRGRQGKSTVAHMVAHWLSLLADEPLPVRTYRKDQCTEALAALAQGEIVVLDDPFGESDYRPDETLFAALAAHGPNAGQVVLATRHEPFVCASAEHGRVGLPIVSSEPQDWWHPRELQFYGQRFKLDVFAQVEADPVTYNTPFRVMQAAEGRSVSNDEVAATAQWLARDLEERAPYALLTLAVRLQDFHEPIPAGELRAAVGYEAKGASVGHGGLLRSFHVEHEYLRIGHPEDIEGVDRMMREHHDVVQKALTELSTELPWAGAALCSWEAVAGSSEPLDPSQIDLSTLFEWTFQLAQRAAARSPEEGLALLRYAFQHAPDSWALREVAFALARLWGGIAAAEGARELVGEITAERERRGTYALLEAILRIQVKPPAELLAIAVSAVFALAREGRATGELVLIFDGLLWRPLPASENTREQMFEALLDAAKRSTEMSAGFAAAATYHRPGAQFLLDRTFDNPLQWTGLAVEYPEIVAWLIQWHVVHQARLAASFTRESFLTADSDEIQYLNRGFFADSPPLQDDQAKALADLIRALKECPEHAGWAVRMAMDVRAWAGSFEFEHVADIVNDCQAPDLALISCASYKPDRGIKDALGRYYQSHGRELLQRTLGTGFSFEGVQISRPRFRLVPNGWDVRRFWRVRDPELEELFGSPLKPSALLGELQSHAAQALQLGADEAGLATLLQLAERGDTNVLASLGSRDGESVGRASLIASLLTEASHILAADGDG